MSPQREPAIPRFRLSFEEQLIEDFTRGVRDILDSTQITEGRHVRRFEEAFAAFSGAPHAIAVSSGTAALESAFRALRVQGGAVVVPTNTFYATAIAAERAGARVVLCDLEPGDFGLCPDALERVLDDTRDVRAVCVVHIGGVIAAQVERIAELCRARGIALVEDAAHAQGARRGALRAGLIGDVGCFSFYATKVMSTGEGGMVTTADPAIARRVRSAKDFGRDAGNPLLHRESGFNYQVTEIGALLGCLELERVAARIDRRRQLAERYRRKLAGTRYVVASVEREADQAATGAVLSSHYKVIVQTPMDNDRLRAFCAQHGVDLAGEVYRFPLHSQPYYAQLGEGRRFPEAERFCRHHICPPLFPELRDEEVDQVCAVLGQAEQELGS